MTPRAPSPALAPARIAAIIPVGTLASAKSRLGESLDAEEREALVGGLLARTVVAALAVDRLEDVLVASPDRDVLRRAADLGARTLRQRSRGLNAGLAEARTDVVAGGAEAILVLPIDIPFVTSAAIAAVLEPLDRPVHLGPLGPTGPTGPAGSHGPLDRPVHLGPHGPLGPTGPARTVILVTDRHGTGTNALALRPPDIIDFAFGPGSRRAHRAAAQAAGAAYIEIGGPLAVDLDTPDDLVFVESIDVDPITAEGIGAG